MSVAELRQEDIAFQANLYESSNPTRRWLHNARREWITHALYQVARDKAAYLEIGIGCGIYTQLMAKRGPVTAVDINSAFVSAANQLHNVSARIADITTTSFEPTHDIALCSEVIEHVPDSPSALRNIFASLKPGGYLILTTPNSYSTMELAARLLAFGPVVKLARAIYGESVDDLGHINRLTQGQLRSQIDAAGFELVRRTDVALYIPVLAEFGGVPGARICQWAARKLAGTRFSQLLWTQCWLLRRPI
jgi:SAM-dependent methyltransferase